MPVATASLRGGPRLQSLECCPVGPGGPPIPDYSPDITNLFTGLSAPRCLIYIDEGREYHSAQRSGSEGVSSPEYMLGRRECILNELAGHAVALGEFARLASTMPVCSLLAVEWETRDPLECLLRERGIPSGALQS